jgi:uncharacterized iron-regulated membrane protein
MNFYLFFRKLHLYSTLVAIIPLAIISVTGLLLSFEAEITQWQAEERHENDTQFILAPEALDALHLHTEQILEENQQCKLTYIRHDIEAESLPWIYLSCPEERKKFVVNLNTNQHYPLEKEGFQLILDLHRTLLLGNVGRNLVGIATLIIIFNIISGLALWFIRGKKIKLDKDKFKITTRSGLSLRHLHSVVALYLTPILLIISLTGVSWTWRSEIYQGLAYLQIKEQAMPVMLTQAHSNPYDQSMSLHAQMASTKSVYKKIAQDYPQYKILGISIAKTPTSLMTVRLKEKKNLAFTPHLYLSLDAYTLEELYKTDGWQADVEDSIYSYRIMQYGLHTGFLFGTAGKILWAICDLLFIACILALGIYLWLKRRSVDTKSKLKSVR